MKYPFMTMPDETEITHSSIFEENGVEKIRVYIERPVEGGFIDATCILPDYTWQNNGFSDEEIENILNNVLDKDEESKEEPKKEELVINSITWLIIKDITL